MPGILRCGAVNLNEPAVVWDVINALRAVTGASDRQPLAVRGKYHFTVPTGPITTEPG